jgi:hypothetical protein
MLRMMILMIIIKNPDTIIELFLTQLNNIIAELIYFFPLARCEWIRSERFAKKLREEAQKREKNNPMKAGRQLRNQGLSRHCQISEILDPVLEIFPV